MRRHSEGTVRKTLSLNAKELAQLQKLLGASSQSEAVRRAIRERLAVERAVQAHADLGSSKGIELVTHS